MTDKQTLTSASTLGFTWREVHDRYQNDQIPLPMPVETYAQHRLHQISDLVDLPAMMALIENEWRLRITKLNDLIIKSEDEIRDLTRPEHNRFLSEQERAEIADYLDSAQQSMNNARLEVRRVRREHAVLQAALDGLDALSTVYGPDETASDDGRE